MVCSFSKAIFEHGTVYEEKEETWSVGWWFGRSISDDVCRCASLRSIFLLRSVEEAWQIERGKGSNWILKEQKGLYLNHA